MRCGAVRCSQSTSARDLRTLFRWALTYTNATIVLHAHLPRANRGQLHGCCVCVCVTLNWSFRSGGPQCVCQMRVSHAYMHMWLTCLWWFWRPHTLNSDTVRCGAPTVVANASVLCLWELCFLVPFKRPGSHAQKTYQRALSLRLCHTRALSMELWANTYIHTHTSDCFISFSARTFAPPPPPPLVCAPGGNGKWK